MNISSLFDNSVELDKTYLFYINKKLLKPILRDEDLILAHIEKAKHNLLFFDKNRSHIQFNDWLIVILYYSLYHVALALIINKNYVSKNHTASLIFLIKHYSILKEDIELLDELSIKKGDAELYTELKEDRHKASYDTKYNFSQEKIDSYKNRVVSFLHKAEHIINNDF